jgi:hypothetical protein
MLIKPILLICTLSILSGCSPLVTVVPPSTPADQSRMPVFRVLLPNESEKLLDKRDVDYFFGLTKSQWEMYWREFGLPGWEFKLNKFETGTLIVGIERSTDFGVSIQPLFRNDWDPPTRLVITAYFRDGVLPLLTQPVRNQMEAATQRDLGPDYYVELRFEKTDKLDAVSIGVTRSGSIRPNSGVISGERSTPHQAGQP